ncbi:phosphoadenylylsulfate reductase (thioredoxin) [Thermaerobacter marianensis DSM 12885]|uniref:Adenosine 5'-phosphosulfate reductase n=1 Tax=Thermaerobacter marianensis (strain ATCC 700841 / DSM 12885 / JCM 10246 / 7p75a) TaxID=644966 RepID=E6SH76_THEM7|nr:phosphoadenylyl-sulfate reductase [Thermaerobacter marianensis]ADU51740.1 phosphoadenylylsulfate reductase (thioredoxin) [Thermaerobacter marianensis DSM 12885]
MRPAGTTPPSRRDVMDDYEAGQWAVHFEDKEPEDLLEWAFDRFGEQRLALISSFQAEASVLIDMAWRINPRVRVVTVDTGRLPQETYELIDRVRDHYGITVEVVMPDPVLIGRMVQRHGINLFYKDVNLRLLCCHLRKVLPLQGVLDHLDAWVTGLRRAQWATRANIRKVEIDHDHGGLVKLNPLADWSDDDVWDYIRQNGVPYHALYDRGYTSIGCAPCTRPVEPGADPRSGRWWWEKDAPKECGMHCPIETGGFEHEVEAILGHDLGGQLSG